MLLVIVNRERNKRFPKFFVPMSLQIRRSSVNENKWIIFCHQATFGRNRWLSELDFVLLYLRVTSSKIF